MPVIRGRHRAIGAAIFALALVAAPALASSAAASPAATVSGTTVARTTVAGTPVSLALLVPLTVRPTGTGLIDSAALTVSTAPTGILTRELDALIGTPAVIGIDPMIIASIRVLGTSAPASAIAWLERLESASNETFALAYADADPASLARIDALSIGSPLGFDFAIDPGHFGPAVTATPTTTPTTTAGASAGANATPTPSPTPTGPSQGTTPGLPTTTAEVLQWAYTLPSIAWPSDDTVVNGDLSDLASAGYQDVVLSSTNLSATDSGLVSLTGIQGVVSDVGISSLVRSSVSSAGNAEQDSLTRLNSALTGMEAVSPGRTVVATLDRRWSLGALNIDDLYADLQTQTSVIPVGLDAVLQGAKPAAQVTDEPGDATRSAQLKSALSAVADEDNFATVADNPLLVREPRRLELLSLLAVWWVQNPDVWSTQLQTFLTDSSTLVTSVQIVRGSDLFVGAGSTNIPVTVSNASSVPVTVYVTVTSPSSVLQVQKQRIPLKIEPGSSNKAAIPVQALTDGNVTTTVTLTSATGVSIGSPDYVAADLQPGWEGVGTTVVVIALVLVFGGGIARNIVKRRRARAAAAAESAPPTEPAGE